jgi:CRP-like cAMP-binding protein
MLMDLTDEQIAQIAAICREEAYDVQDIIIRQGEPSDEIYVIHQGSVNVALSGEQLTAEALVAPGPHAILSLGQGQVFGEMALVDQGPRSATVRCTTSGTKLYVIRRDDFVRLCEQYTDIGYRVMRNLAIDLSFKLRHRNLSWKR